MYHDHYDLSELPFENTPNPALFFESERHQEALAAIEYTIRMRKGIVMVTGAIGAGKTTVGQAMRERCGHGTIVVEVMHGHATRTSLIAQILRSLQITGRPEDDHAMMVQRMRDQLVQRAHADQAIVLFVDEAQTMSDEVLEELRLLSNFDTARKKLVQIVLLGQPELRQRIREPRHEALRQRIVTAKQLQALNRHETGEYILHRLKAVSRNPQQPAAAFDDEAIGAIYHHTGGIPRLINTACDNCLLMGFVQETFTITGAIVDHVLEDMVPAFDDGVPALSEAAEPAPALRIAGGL